MPPSAHRRASSARCLRRRRCRRSRRRARRERSCRVALRHLPAQRSLTCSVGTRCVAARSTTAGRSPPTIARAISTLVSRGARARDDLAVTHHGDAGGVVDDFLQLVRDDQDRRAALCERDDRARRTRSISVGASAAVGSSSNSTAGSRSSSRSNSTRCCTPIGNVSTNASGSTSSPCSRRERAHAFARRGSIDPPAAPRLASEQHVLPHAQPLDQLEMLVHEPDAPRVTTSPSSGCNSPKAIAASVDFPAPFSPTSA